MRVPRTAGIVAALLATAALAAGCSDDDAGRAKDLPKHSATSTTTVPYASESAGSESSASSTTTPAGAPVDLAAPFRVTAAPAGTEPRVVVTLILDPQCPACKMFEQINGPTLASFADDPQVAIDYRVIAFLDRASSDDYSSRAANALYCAWADAAPAGKTAAWRDYLERLFENQSAEGGAGLPDSKLVALGDGDFPGLTGCVSSEAHRPQVKANTDAVLGNKDFKGTPTVLINGEDFQPGDPADLRQAIIAAKG